MSQEREVFLAPNWALEPIGVQEIQGRIWSIDPRVQIRYDTVNDLLVLKGSISSQQEKQYVQILQDFMEANQFEDLLDIPRLRRLELVDVAGTTPTQLLPGRESASQDTTSVGHLLDVDIPLESSNTLPHVQPTSKVWLPSFETQAIYADDQYGLIPEVAFITGTDISREVLNHSVRFRISSIVPEAVNDALRRLNNLEAPMMLANKPRKSDMLIGPPEMSIFYCTPKQFSGLRSQRPVAFSRVLTLFKWKVDIAGKGLFIAKHFDRKTQSYKFPQNVINPPVIEWNGSEVIEDWKGFTYPPLVSGEALAETHSMQHPLAAHSPPVQSETAVESNPSMTAAGQKDTPQQNPEVSTPDTNKQITGIKRRRVLGGSEPSGSKSGQSRSMSMSNVLSYLKSPPASPTTKETPGTPSSTTSPIPLSPSPTTPPLFALPSAFSRPTPQRSFTHPSPSSSTTRRKWSIFPLSEMDKGQPSSPALGATHPATKFAAESTKPSDKDTPETPKRPYKPYCCPRHIKLVFQELQPALTAAKYFPGTVSLEVQIGIIVVETFPSNMQDKPLNLQPLQQMLLKEAGVDRATVSTTFLNRVGCSPADMEYIINMEFNGKRLFEREPIEQSICYEFHCVTPAESIVIKVDTNGQMTITRPTAVLSTMHIHFSCFAWDAAIFLLGHRIPGLELGPHIKQAAQSLVGSLFIKPDQTRMHMLGQASNLTLKHVLIKRTTYHRHINHSTAQATDDAFRLRITETQDLVVTTHPVNKNLFEAVCGTIPEMTAAGRQWWEVGLSSPPIDNLLKNERPKAGPRPRAWSSTDILGDDVDLVADKRQGPGFAMSSSDSSHPVAAAIGSAGLGSLLRLMEIVVLSIDAVGGANGAMGVETTASDDGGFGSVVGSGARGEDVVEEYW